MMNFLCKSMVFAAFLSGATLAHAQDYTSMLPSQLFEAATEAIDNNDRRDLMKIMKEIQARELVWFKPVRAAQCDYRPNSEILNSRETGVRARLSWETWTKSKRLEEQSCECFAGVGTFEDMITELFEKDIESLGEPEFEVLQSMHARTPTLVDNAIVKEYKTFFNETCRS